MLFADRLEVWNPGELHPSLTPEALRAPHASIPRNPLIAEPLFLARYIEKAGTGILDMINLCRNAKLRAPGFRQEGGQFIQTLWRPKTVERDQVGTMSGLSGEQVEVLQNSAEDKTLLELMVVAGRTNRTKFRDQVINPLLTDALLEMTIPNKPKSRLQKYRLTAKGQFRINLLANKPPYGSIPPLMGGER
ncbi:MAG: hypothetical protein FWG74_03150 [Planctomycetes bacterium]|nr:hypothetical protein [Planctomycetota bacterium]